MPKAGMYVCVCCADACETENEAYVCAYVFVTYETDEWRRQDGEGRLI
jgi:hypothetical protein